MATYEHAVLMQYKDQNGDMHITYPITKAENVDGLYGDAALTGVPTAPTAAPGTNTTQVATTAFVQQELEDVKKSVSDGKTAVANAITAKGVTTATDATFDTMAANISAIESGSGIGLNVFTQETEPETKEGVWVQTANPHQSVVVGDKTYANATKEGDWIWDSVSTLPYDFYSGSAVVLNNEIHILGSYDTSSRTKHYKWNGSSWVSVSTLPYNFYNGFAVVLNDEIHILGSGNSSYVTKHYKWSGSSWVSVSTIPYGFYSGSAVVLNGEIHILGSNSATSAQKNHYKWSGSTWSFVSTLPYNFVNGFAVVLNGEIHILGSSSNSSHVTNHYKWSGSSWSFVSTLPYGFRNGRAVVLNDEIHIFGGSYDTSSRTKHYKWNGSSWVSVSTLPYSFYNGFVEVLNGEIHIVGSSDTSSRRSHYYYHTSNTADSSVGSKIAVYQNPSTASGTYATNFISGVPIAGENNKFPSGFDDVYYIDDFGNVEESPTYYGDGTQWIKFKN